jgi:hypothetical protein
MASFKFIPAQPGYQLCTPITGRIIDGVAREPVIAWRIHASDSPDYSELNNKDFISADPIVPGDDQLRLRTSMWAIETPNGVLSIPGDRDFTDDAALIAYWQEQEACHKELKRQRVTTPGS